METVQTNTVEITEILMDALTAPGVAKCVAETILKLSGKRKRDAVEPFIYPSFKRTYNSHLAALRKKEKNANKALASFNISWKPNEATQPLTVEDLRNGVLVLRDLVNKKTVWIPKPVKEILFKRDELSNRDCAVVLKRTARWLGLCVDTKKKQKRNSDGTVSSTNYYTLR